MVVRSDYLPSHLTPEQVEAITYRGGPLQIVADPGSGKTEVIAWRVAHLLKSGAASPESVLVTTFTEKAALELKDRIQSRLSDISIADINVERIQVSTIHSLKKIGDMLYSSCQGKNEHLRNINHYNMIDNISCFDHTYP